jgi:hypothetical protein
MGKFVLVFKGGASPQTEQESEAVTQAWQEWFDSLGDAVADHGNPFGAAKTVNPDGNVFDGASPATGYSILHADSIDGAVGYAKLCPQLQAGGQVEIYETFTVM